MDQQFKDLSSSKEKDSTWVLKLIVDISTPPQLILGDIYTSINMKSHNFEVALSSTDIITFLTKPSYVNELIMENVLKYLKGRPFYFKGYTSVKDYDRLRDYLIDSALITDGTQPTVAIRDEFINEPKS